MNASTSIAAEETRFERACQWFMDLREQPESPELVAEWLAWCRADPLNREAFERAREVWQTTADVGSALSPPPTRRSLVRPLALAATLAAAALLLYRFIPGDAPATTLATNLGENRTVKLADGSTVALGASSQLAAHFDNHARQLTLQEGEAYFRVKRDRTRPFVVAVGDLRVTALGTAFNIRAGSGRIVVTVSEGLVEVTAPSAVPSRLAAGQQASIDTKTEQLQLSRISPDTVASWQTGRLEFTREPLRDVIASVNRYSQRPVALGDPKLGDLRFTGTVFCDRVEDWLRGLPKIFPVDIHEEENAVVISGFPR